MSATLLIATLYDALKKKLELVWVTGEQFGGRLAIWFNPTGPGMRSAERAKSV